MASNVYWEFAHAINYDLPQPSEYPKFVVSWRMSVVRSILLVHDMQRYFLDRFDLTQQPASDVLDNIESVVNAARRLDIPVVYTAQPGGMTAEQRGLLKDFWGPGMTTAKEHRQIIDRLSPGPNDLVLDKWRYSAFTRTTLEDFLQQTGRDQIVICGVYAHVGILATALDAYAKDIEAFILADAVADFDRARHLLTLDYTARTSARILQTAEALTEWEKEIGV